MYKGQNYVNIESKPNTGYRLVEVLVNGELLWNAKPDPVEETKPEEDIETMSLGTEETATPSEATAPEAANDAADEAEEATEETTAPGPVGGGVSGGTRFAAEEAAGVASDQIGEGEEPAARGQLRKRQRLLTKRMTRSRLWKTRPSRFLSAPTRPRVWA